MELTRVNTMGVLSVDVSMQAASKREEELAAKALSLTILRRTRMLTREGMRSLHARQKNKRIKLSNNGWNKSRRSMLQ